MQVWDTAESDNFWLKIGMEWCFTACQHRKAILRRKRWWFIVLVSRALRYKHVWWEKATRFENDFTLGTSDSYLNNIHDISMWLQTQNNNNGRHVGFLHHVSLLNDTFSRKTPFYPDIHSLFQGYTNSPDNVLSKVVLLPAQKYLPVAMWRKKSQ